MLKLKTRRDPQGFASSTIVVLIASHIYIGLERGSQGFTLKNRHQSLLCKVYGDKSDDSAVYPGHVTLSYLLCPTNIQIYIPYSRKYWQELNLVVWSQTDITKILAEFNLAVVKWDRQTAKFSSYTVL